MLVTIIAYHSFIVNRKATALLTFDQKYHGLKRLYQRCFSALYLSYVNELDVIDSSS